MKKLTQDEFIKACEIKHENRYKYEFTVYENTRSDIIVECPIHGTFSQNAKNHKDGQGCSKCSENYTLTKNEFIEFCSELFKNKYSYELLDSDYIKSGDYIYLINSENGLLYVQLAANHKKMIHPKKIESSTLIEYLKIIHENKYEYVIETETVYATSKIKLINVYSDDETMYRVDRHLSGMVPNKVTINYFVKRCSEDNDNKYIYDYVHFNTATDSVDIICPQHGTFSQSVTNHLYNNTQCPECAGHARYTKDKLLKKFNDIHSGKYEYPDVTDNTKTDDEITIICKIHGEFKQKVAGHLYKANGCPECATKSTGEQLIKDFLDKENITYIKEKSFDDCKHINILSFDFYIPHLDILIEFDGVQHFRPVEYFGGAEEFANYILRDECKNKWCLKNNKKLIRISYLEKTKVNDILKNNLLM